jgi:hypothetical protein
VVGFTKLEPPGFGGSMQPAAAITRIKMSPAAIEIASAFIIDAYEHHDLLILFKYPEKLTRLFFFPSRISSLFRKSVTINIDLDKIILQKNWN